MNALTTVHLPRRSKENNMSESIRACVIGTGIAAGWHVKAMLARQTEIPVVCEPSPKNYAQVSKLFKEAGLRPPPNEPNLEKLLQEYGNQLDAAFIITPHVLHHDQTKMCMEAGLDVLLEKPMVMNAAEAHSLIETRNRTGRLLVVAFQGGLSAQVRTAVKMLRSGEYGELLNISSTVWQNWYQHSGGTWRSNPEMSGGGFMFDTGAHVLNTVCDLAGEDFAEVAAWLDNRGRDVDILGAVIGRLRSGALVTINACGSTIPVCSSNIMVFTDQAIFRTTMWGTNLEIQRAGESEFTLIEFPPSLGPWEQFLKVRQGEIPNPCPPEVGLRMARLWDAIKSSAAQQGMPVQCETAYVVKGA
jgi:predicted dehydrogenase